MSMAKAEVLRGWALFWLALGACVPVALIAAPGIPAWSITVLCAFAGACFSFSSYYFGGMKTKAGTVCILLLVWGVAFMLGYTLWPGRHLNRTQREGLAEIRDSLPKNCGMLVYVPIESNEAQNYGKEIQAALQSRVSKANLIYSGAMVTPVGIVVGVLSSLNSCGFAGEMASVQMHTLGIPARLQENFPNDDEKTIIICVGIKPPYD
jgi:hypothetical protein